MQHFICFKTHFHLHSYRNDVEDYQFVELDGNTTRGVSN